MAVNLQRICVLRSMKAAQKSFLMIISISVNIHILRIYGRIGITCGLEIRANRALEMGFYRIRHKSKSYVNTKPRISAAPKMVAARVECKRGRFINDIYVFRILRTFTRKLQLSGCPHVTCKYSETTYFCSTSFLNLNLLKTFFQN